MNKFTFNGRNRTANRETPQDVINVFKQISGFIIIKTKDAFRDFLVDLRDRLSDGNADWRYQEEIADIQKSVDLHKLNNFQKQTIADSAQAEFDLIEQEHDLLKKEASDLIKLIDDRRLLSRRVMSGSDDRIMFLRKLRNIDGIIDRDLKKEITSDKRRMLLETKDMVGVLLAKEMKYTGEIEAAKNEAMIARDNLARQEVESNKYINGYDEYLDGKVEASYNPTSRNFGELTLKRMRLDLGREINSSLSKDDVDVFIREIIDKHLSSSAVLNDGVLHLTKYLYSRLKARTGGGLEAGDINTGNLIKILENFYGLLHKHFERRLQHTNFYEYIYHRDDMEKIGKHHLSDSPQIEVDIDTYRNDNVFIHAIINHICFDGGGNLVGPVIGLMQQSINEFVAERNENLNLDAIDRDINDISYEDTVKTTNKMDREVVIESMKGLGMSIKENFDMHKADIISKASEALLRRVRGLDESKIGNFNIAEASEKVSSRFSELLVSMVIRNKSINNSFKEAVLAATNLKGFETGTNGWTCGRILVNVMNYYFVYSVLELLEEGGVDSKKSEIYLRNLNAVLSSDSPETEVKLDLAGLADIDLMGDEAYERELGYRSRLLSSSTNRVRLTKFMKPDEMAKKLLSEGEDDNDQKDSSWLTEYKADFLTQSGIGNRGFVDTGKSNTRIYKR